MRSFRESSYMIDDRWTCLWKVTTLFEIRQRLKAIISAAAPQISSYWSVPGTKIDDSTRQISLSHGDLDAQRDDFGSPQKKLKSHFLYLQAVLKNQVRRLTRDALGLMLYGAGQLVAVSRIPLSIRLALVFVLSRMSQSPQEVLKKRNRPNAR